MPKPLHEMSSWDPSTQQPVSGLPPDAWQATRAQTAMATQFLRDKEDYLGDGAQEIGRKIDDRHRELFVSCDPGEAMQQQLEHLKPEYIALHDIGTASSRRMVQGLAAASGRGVQKLIIRRQGLGIGLATLEFTDVPAGNGQTVRVYTTEVDADTHSRHEISRMLLAYSRLGVVMVGDLAPHVLASSLKPLSDAITEGPWINRQLLILPLTAANALATHVPQLIRKAGMDVKTTPQVMRPNDAWQFVAGTWNRMREPLVAGGVVLPELGTVSNGAATSAKRVNGSNGGAKSEGIAVPSAPQAAMPYSPFATLEKVPPQRPQRIALPMQPMPEVPSAGSRSSAPSVSPLQKYVNRIAEQPGTVSVCVFDLSTQRALAHAGARPGPAMLAAEGASLVTAMLGCARALGMTTGVPEAALTVGGHHLVLRAVPKHPGVMLHAVLDKSSVNLTAARLQLQRLDSLIEDATTV